MQDEKQKKEELLEMLETVTGTVYGDRAFPYALHTIDDFGRQPVAEHH